MNRFISPPALRRLRPLALAVLLLGACDDPSRPEQAGPPARLNIVSGDEQSAEVGTELPDPLVVKVVDDKGRPVKGQIVNFRVVSGGGSVFAGTAQTNDEGVAQERWTLGTSAADSQRVEARAVDPSTGQALVFATFRAIAHPAAAARVTAVGPATLNGPAGSTLADSLRARVTDVHGNPIAGASVAWTVPSGGGTVSPATSTTDAAGVARTAFTVGNRLDAPQTVEARSGALGPASFTGTAAFPAQFTATKSGDAQTAQVATTVPQPLVLRLGLPDGRPLVGAAVRWLDTHGGGVTPENTVTDAQGEARTVLKLGQTPTGTVRTFAYAGPASVLAATFTTTATPATPAEPAQITDRFPVNLFQPAPGSTWTAGATVRDAYGNPIPGATVTWTVVEGGGSVTPTQSVTNGSGQATTTWTLGPQAGLINRLAIQSGAAKASIATSYTHSRVLRTVTFLPSPYIPVELTVGGSASLYAEVKDQDGMVVNSGVTWHWSSTDPAVAQVEQATTTSPANRVIGVAPGTATINVTAVGNGGAVTGSASGSKTAKVQ